MGWPSFLKIVLIGFAAVMAVLFAFVAVMNPYGNLPLRLMGSHAMLDINQRFQFPSVVRSGRYDSVVVGTSTARLLDPLALEAAFGGRFANLSLNDGRAWEQYKLAKLFLETAEHPRLLLIGLDRVWCWQNAGTHRTTRRGFPDWMYDGNPANDWLYLLNGKAVEISARLVAYRLGHETARYPANGYQVFTPSEAEYDAAKARIGIWGEGATGVTRQDPPYAPTDADRAAWTFPAIKWLDELLMLATGETSMVLVFMPVHIAMQPHPGSRAAAEEALCKTRIADVARRHGAFLIDFRIPSPITTADANYWDGLHYRLPIVDRIVAGLERAVAEGGDDPGGDWRTLGGR